MENKMKIMSLSYSFYKIGIILAVLFFCFAANTNINAQQKIAWETNFEQAMAQAKRLNRPLFLHFYGDNCPPCKLMETKVFQDGQVINQMNGFFIPLKIKVSEQTQLAKKYSIQVIPTDIVLAQDGRLIHRRQGGIATERFLEYLQFLLSNVNSNANQNTNQNTNRHANQHANQHINQEVAQPVSVPIVSVPEPTNSSLISSLPFQASTPQTVIPPQPAGTPTNVASIQKTEQPKIETAQTEQSPKTEQLLRDPFTRQPVEVNRTSSEPINPVRLAEKPTPQEEKTISQEKDVFQNKAVFPKTVDTVFVPSFHKEPATVPVVSPMGVQSSPDETATATATTMVEVPLGLEGYCPVLLSTEERWIPGNPAYYTMYRGHVFRFSSEEAMAEFMKTPALYAPVAMGEDIVLMVDRNKKVYGNRKFGAWFQGRVFLFSNQDSLDSFAARPEYYAEIALKYETALKRNSGRFF
jgi:thioredoxin-related protein/YHS domain-containing protein